MSNVRPVIEEIEREALRTDLPDFRVGDTVRVQLRIVEGDKERLQAFEGVVIRRRRGGNRANFTVRKVSYGVGVERTIPYFSPRTESIKVLSRGKVRRGRLYFLRERRGKAARIKERIDTTASSKKSARNGKSVKASGKQAPASSSPPEARA